MDAIGKKIKAAAKILKQRGWCKDRLEDEKGHVCALGAIALADGDGVFATSEDSLLPVADRIVSCVPSGDLEWEGDALEKLVWWNNTKCKGKGDIIKLFRKAAKAQ